MTSRHTPGGANSQTSTTLVSASGVVTQYDNVTHTTWDDSFVGGDSPRWRDIIKAGGNATNGYTRVEHKPGFYALRASGSRKSTAPSSLDQFQTTYSQTALLSPLVVLNAYDKVSGKLLGKIQAHRTSVQSGVVLGELRETLQLLRNPVKGLFNAVTSFTRKAESVVKQRNKAYRDNRLYGKRIPRHYRTSEKGSFKALSDLWLEAQFGWQPLLSDINGAIDAYKKFDYPPPRVRLTASSTESLSVISSGAGISSAVLGVYYVGTRSTKTRSQGRGSVWLSEHGTHAPSHRMTRFGLDPFADFIPTIYELIPFSFAVDYFSTLGAVIQQSMVSVQGVSAAYVGVETVTTTSINCGLERVSNSNYSVTHDFTSQEATTSYYERKSLRPIDIRAQDLTFQIPGLRQGFNLTALLTSKVSK